MKTDKQILNRFIEELNDEEVFRLIKLLKQQGLNINDQKNKFYNTKSKTEMEI